MPLCQSFEDEVIISSRAKPALESMEDIPTTTYIMSYCEDLTLTPPTPSSNHVLIPVEGNAPLTGDEESGLLMTPQHYYKERELHSPTEVVAMSPEYHLAVTDDGDVEVEIVSSLRARIEDTCSLMEGSGCLDFATPTTISTPVDKRTLPPASFPSHIPFPTLSESQSGDVGKPKQNDEMEDQGSVRTQKMMEAFQKHIHKVDQDSERKRMAAAASVGIKSILSAMRLHTTNARVQRYGCGVLQKLASQNDTNRSLIANAGGILDILSAMKHHASRSSVQESGCCVLSFLCKTSDGSALIVQDEGVDVIISAMRTFPNHSSIQKHGCLTLLGLACNHVDYNAQIARSGGIPVIMEAIKNHREHSGIREYGSAALWSLSYMNTNRNQMAIEAAGGLDAIFDVLSLSNGNHSNDNGNYLSLAQSCSTTYDMAMDVCKLQEYRCLHSGHSHETEDSKGEDQEGGTETNKNRRREGSSVDEILSVFVRPLQ